MIAESAQRDERTCTHCALPLPKHRARSADSEAYCCSGCFVAHHLLARSNEDDPSDQLLARIVLSAFLAMGVMVFSLALYRAPSGVEDETADALHGLFRLGAMALGAPILLLLGAPLADAVLSTRRFLSSDALVLAGTLAAWIVSTWNTFTHAPIGKGEVYFETGTMVLVLVSLGHWLDVKARARARDKMHVLAERAQRPIARVSSTGDDLVAVEALAVGDTVRLRPGDVVPVDGRVVDGRSFVDTSSLTGEEMRRSVGPGDEVLAGTTLVDGSVLARVARAPGSSVRDRVETLLAEAAASKPRLVRVADRVAGALLPLVLVLAAGTTAWHWNGAGPERALMNGLSVILIACPCALGLATPLAFWTAMGEAWRLGALVRGGDVLERLARVRRAFLDKTGTLTSGELSLVEAVALAETPRHDLLRRAAALERGSEHPVGRALRAAVPEGASVPRVDGFRALPGIGVEGRIDGHPHRLVALAHSTLAGDAAAASAPHTVVVLECDGAPLGLFRFASEPLPEAADTIARLAARGLAPTILTGDADGPARALAELLGVPVESGLLPTDKAERVRDAGPDRTLFVGDGLNDALALAAADVGVAVDGATPASLETASIGLLTRDLTIVPRVIDLARRATRVARVNLAWAFGYNALGLWLAASGRLTPVFAAVAMVLSSAFVVLNSSRIEVPTASRPRLSPSLRPELAEAS